MTGARDLQRDGQLIWRITRFSTPRVAGSNTAGIVTRRRSVPDTSVIRSLGAAVKTLGNSLGLHTPEGVRLTERKGALRCLGHTEAFERFDSPLRQFSHFS
jgi:hypothetical protein